MLLVGGGVLGVMLLGDRRLANASRRARVAAPAGTWVWPVPAVRGRRPVISDGWSSPRRDRDGTRRIHRGADIMFRRAHRQELVAEFPPGTADGSTHYFVPPGTVALAAGAGSVWSAGWTPRGYAVVVDHGTPWATYYTHLSSLAVRAGDRVRAGQTLGVIGADPLDRQSLRHLHFEIWHGGASQAAIDPAPLLRSWDVVASGGNNV